MMTVTIIISSATKINNNDIYAGVTYIGSRHSNNLHWKLDIGLLDIQSTQLQVQQQWLQIHHGQEYLRYYFGEV